MAIISNFPGGGGLKPDEILAFVNGAHIEFAATAGDNTLHLRRQTAGYDCTIYWGDGSKTTAPTGGGNVIHNYAQAGTYHIFVTGKSFAGFFVNDQTGKGKYMAVYSLGRWSLDTATNFSGCFRGCIALTTLPSDLFRYNTAVTDFSRCFYGCTSLATIPTDLFRYNTAVTNFTGCFYNCTSLATIPTDLFRYNTAVTNFASCFYGCTKLTLIASIFGTDYSMRFAGKAVNFTNCFNRSSFTGVQGVAPQLWNFTYGSVTSTGCFGGEGNSATSLSNYADIPTGWK